MICIWTNNKLVITAAPTADGQVTDTESGITTCIGTSIVPDGITLQRFCLLHSHTLTHTLTHSLTHLHTHSLTHTHTHTHTHILKTTEQRGVVKPTLHIVQNSFPEDIPYSRLTKHTFGLLHLVPHTVIVHKVILLASYSVTIATMVESDSYCSCWRYPH